MTGYLNLILRLTIWFLLTADFSVTNIIIGVSIASFLPGLRKSPGSLKDWLRAFREVVIAIPQAYKEALEIMIFPHKKEEITLEKVAPQRTPGLIFLDVFLITFTPKTIVLKCHKNGFYEVHWVRRNNRNHK